VGEVTSLDERRPHYAGPCACLNCAREWTGVVPLAAKELECPSCGEMRGVMYSAREVRLIRALEKVATGYAPGANTRINWDIAKAVAKEALAAEGWGDLPNPTEST
jgi:hypothetical protein